MSIEDNELIDRLSNVQAVNGSDPGLIGSWDMLLPGRPPETVADAVRLRAAIRVQLENRPGLFALFGFRVSRKKKAARATTDLVAPTEHDLKVAATLVRSGAPLHEIASFYQEKGIGLTQNRLSQLGGARP